MSKIDGWVVVTIPWDASLARFLVHALRCCLLVVELTEPVASVITELFDRVAPLIAQLVDRVVPVIAEQLGSRVPGAIRLSEAPAPVSAELVVRSGPVIALLLDDSVLVTDGFAHRTALVTQSADLSALVAVVLAEPVTPVSADSCVSEV